VAVRDRFSLPRENENEYDQKPGTPVCDSPAAYTSKFRHTGTFVDLSVGINDLHNHSFQLPQLGYNKRVEYLSTSVPRLNRFSRSMAAR
jgi:hypothetical protein